MKKIPQVLFALLLACMVSTAAAQTKKGDVNGDKQVTVADVTALVNVILGKATRNDACDVNGDTFVTKADVTALVYIILGKTPPEGDSTVVVDDPPAWEPANAPKHHTDDVRGNDGRDVNRLSRGHKALQNLSDTTLLKL